MRTFDPTLLAGAAMALVAGVASAEWGLAPIRHALAAEAPALDAAMADAEPQPMQADLPSDAQNPPAVVVPIGAAPTPAARADRKAAVLSEPPAGADEERPPRADEGTRPADGVDAPEVDARNPAQEAGRASEAGNSERDPVSPTPTTESAAEDPPPVTSG